MTLSKILVSSTVGLALVLGIAGCSAANVQSQIRDSDASSKMQTRCVRVDMRNNSEMDELFKKYDGWRMFYVSEYTTANKIGTDGSVCFERLQE